MANVERTPMGIGALGFNNLIFKRKFRWTFEVRNICGNPQRTIPKSFVKLAARPSLTLEETEINYLNGKTWLPGRGSWETITVTYYDVASSLNQELYSWLASVYNFLNPLTLEQGSTRNNYAALGDLKILDGCGATLEQWLLGDMWPQAVNFGELDYSSSEEVTIELTLRYAQVQYIPICPKVDINPCCTPCNPSGSGDSSRNNGSGTQFFRSDAINQFQAL